MKKDKLGRIAAIALFLLAALPVIAVSQAVSKADSVLNSGDTVLAIKYLEDDIKLDPSFSSNYYLLGRIYFNQGKLKEAEQQFQLSFDKNGRFLEGLYALGLVQLKRGKIEEAEANLNTGLKKAGKEAKAPFYNGLGLVQIEKGDYTSADRNLRQAIILDSTNAEYRINLGDANFKMKIFPLALAEYEKALLLDTASLEVYFHMAEACLELKDYNCALEKLKVVLRRDSTHADAWMRAGGIYYKAGRSARNPEEAKQRFMETIGSYRKYIELTGGKLDSTTGRAYYEAGMAYLMLGPVGCQDAKKYFDSVLSIPVEPKDIYFYMARACQGCSEYDSALVYFNKHIEWVKKQGEDFKSSIGDEEIARRIGESYESLKDYQNTVTYYKKALEYDSTQDRLLYGVALAYNYLGDYKSALIYYMKRIALGVDEKSWHVYYNAATAALYLSEKAAQAPAPEKNPTGDSSSAVVDPLAGINFAKLASEYLEKVIQYKPDNVKAMNMLASTYLYQLSNCSEAIKLFEKILTMEPDNCEALKSLGYANFAGLCPRNYSLALDYLNKALSCSMKKGNAECSDPSLVLWIAQTYHFRATEKREAKQKEESKKDYKAAFDWYNKALKCDRGCKACQEGIDQVKFEF